MDRPSFLSGRLVVELGDITKLEVDAIVNAANSSLMGGGGVDGAIHKAGGLSILEECRAIRKNYPNGLPTGKAVLTKGGSLPAKYVIHTVGPVWQGGQSSEPDLLKDCYSNSLDLAVQNNIKTIAFPAISTGVYGYPQDLASQVAAKAVQERLSQTQDIEKVIFIFFIREDKDIFLKHCNLSSY